LTTDAFVRAQLAAFAYSEAFACGSLDGMVAVAQVLRTRVRRGWHGGSWMANLNQTGAYAPYQPIEQEFDIGNERFRNLLQDVDDIYSGIDEPLWEGDGLYYCDPLLLQSGRVMRPWFEQRILGDGAHHPRIAQVGTLLIFA